MNHFKKLALATALALLAASGAQAAEEDNLFLLVNSTENVPGVFTGTYAIDSRGTDINGNPVAPRVAGDTFVDDFMLEINDDQNVSFYINIPGFRSGRSTLPQVTLSGFTLTDLTGTTAFAPDDMEIDPFGASGDWTLHSGTYDLEFTGTINANGGRYLGELDTIPVPEPTGWALMMAGLGAMGVLARRRKNLG